MGIYCLVAEEIIVEKQQTTVQDSMTHALAVVCLPHALPHDQRGAKYELRKLDVKTVLNLSAPTFFTDESWLVLA